MADTAVGVGVGLLGVGVGLGVGVLGVGVGLGVGVLGVGVGLGVGVSGVGVGLGVGVSGVGVGLGVGVLGAGGGRVGVSITVGDGADDFSAPEANNPMIAIAATMPIAMIHPPFFFFPGVLSLFCSSGFLLGFS